MNKASNSKAKATRDNNMERIYNLQALRGIAVLLVVFFHLMPVELKYGGSQQILPEYFNFGMFGVDLFFVLSGFVMVLITQGQFKKPNLALSFLYRRASRIYPTYWFYTFLVLGVFLYNPAMVNSSQGHEANILASFLLFPSDTLPLLMVGWTLIHEMYFYLVFFFLLRFIAEAYLPLAMGLWAALVVLVNIVTTPAGPIAKLVFHPLTLEFITGCLLAVLMCRHHFKPWQSRVILGVVALGLSLTMLSYGAYHHYTGISNPQGWWRVLLMGVPAVLIVCCSVCVERQGFVAHPWLIKLGDASYSIYLSHILTLTAAGRLWAMVAPDGKWDNYLALPVLVIAVIVVGMIGYRYVEKPLMQLTRKKKLAKVATPACVIR